MITIKGNIVGFRLRGSTNIIDAITENDRQKMIKDNLKERDDYSLAVAEANYTVEYDSHKVHTFLYNQSRERL